MKSVVSALALALVAVSAGPSIAQQGRRAPAQPAAAPAQPSAAEAAKFKALDAMERLDVEQARAELE